MISQSCGTELNSEPVLWELFLRLPHKMHRSFETACYVDGMYVPEYDALIKCVADAPAKLLLDFGDWEANDKQSSEKLVNKHAPLPMQATIREITLPK